MRDMMASVIRTDVTSTGGDFAVDSTKPMTVVTQFITSDGTDNGDLVEIRRVYVQDGQIIENSFSSLDGDHNIKKINSF